MSVLPSAIVLGIDTPIGLTVIRELGTQGVPVYGIARSENAIGTASRWLKGFSIRPTGKALGSWLPERIRQTGAKVLFAISEGDLIELAELPTEIEGCKCLTPRSAQLGIVLDKAQTLARASKLGFDVPNSWQPSSTDDFIGRATAQSYPVVAKWSDPQAVAKVLDSAKLEFRKAEYCHDAEELLVLLGRYRELGIWPLIQSYCAGVGIGQMLFMHQGRATVKFQHQRLHEWPPEGGVSTLCRALSQAKHSEQMARSEELLASIGWEGPAMVEYRFDVNVQRYWLMEINGRFWGSLPLASKCGASFAWEAYRRAIFNKCDPLPRLRDDLRARYMIPELRRLGRVLFHPREISDPYFICRPWKDIATLITGYFDPKMRYYVFDWSDIGPFATDMANIGRRFLRRERRGTVVEPPRQSL